MTTIKLIVTGASARAEVDGLLTSGMVGIPVTIMCDGAWDGLTKALVCRGGSVIRTIVDVGGAATVPHECMIANATLQIGVEGRNADGTLVIPTVWARCGLIFSGANADADPSTDPTLPVWAQIQRAVGNLDDLNTEAKDNLVAAVNEVLANGGGTVDEATVQRIVEDYLASNPPTITETDPTVPAWAKEPTKPTYTAAEVGADLSGTAEAKVAAHNTGTDTHSDIRLLIQGLTDRLNALANSDDTTLDQLSEVVAYIKSNRTLIDAITTNKVSVSDIVDNLTTNVSNKPLSAAQGVALKALIDAISIPTTLPNPNALTFTGAVTGTYDGSTPLEVLIPSGGSGGSSEEKTWRLIKTIEITEEVASISFNLDEDGNPFEVESLLIYAGLNVKSSEKSQFFVHFNGSAFYITSSNSFVGTSEKSIYWKTDWAGLRVAVMGSSIYDFKGVASVASTVRLADSPQKITSVAIKLQGTTTFTAGKFYFYGR